MPKVMNLALQGGGSHGAFTCYVQSDPDRIQACIDELRATYDRLTVQ